MFGFTDSESPEIVKCKRDYLVEARALRPFLTHFDASNIKNQRQLVTMVRGRPSQPQGNAESDVRQWMEGKAF